MHDQQLEWDQAVTIPIPTVNLCLQCPDRKSNTKDNSTGNHGLGGSYWKYMAEKKCHCKEDSGDSKVVKMIWFIYQEWHKERFLLTLNCHKRPRKFHHDTGDEEIIEWCSWKRNKWGGRSWWIPVPDSNNARDPRHFTLYLCHRACLHSWQQNCEKINSGEKKEEMESAPEGLGSWSTRCRDSVDLNHSFPTPRQTIVT